MDYTPEAWDVDFEELNKAVLIALLLDLVIAKLEAEMAELGEDVDLTLDVEDNLSDVEADADTLASAGMGTDEDYGYYGYEDGGDIWND